MTAVLKPQRTARTMPLRELTGATATPVAVVRANLMPPMVAGKRRLTWLRRRLGVVLIALVALVGAGYAWTTQETSSSQDDLAVEQQHTTRLNLQVRKFDALLALQAQTTALRAQLTTVMASDVQWSTLLTTLNAAAPKGLVVTQVAGKTADPAASTATPDAGAALLPPGVTAVGTLSLSGTASDYRSVAAYVDTLAKVAGFARVEPGSVTAAGKTTSFTIDLSLTAAVRGGRFTPKAGK